MTKQLKGDKTMTKALAWECIKYREKHKCTWLEVKRHFDLPITAKSLLSYCSKVRLGYINDQPKTPVRTRTRKPSEEQIMTDPKWDILSKPIVKEKNDE